MAYTLLKGLGNEAFRTLSIFETPRGLRKMAVVVFERDPHARVALTSMLNALGHGPVLFASNPGRGQHLISRYGSQLKMILSSDARPELETLIDQLNAPEIANLLAFVPLIVMAESGRPRAAFSEEIFNRIDGFLTLPFGLEQFRSEIVKANRHRLAQRSTVLVLESKFRFDWLQLLPSSRCHWTELVIVRSFAELAETWTHRSGTIGAVILDPREQGLELAQWAAQFKRSVMGAATPMAVLSRHAETTREFRLISDLFVESPDVRGEDSKSAALDLLETLSRRTILDWDARKIISSIRRSVKQGDLKAAMKMTKIGLSLDPNRREFHELAGMLAEHNSRPREAIEHFKMALKENPCSPFAYLQLFKLLGDQRDLKKFLDQGSRFCPAHPQVQNAVLEWRGKLQ